MSKQTTRRYTPRGALCSLRRLKQLLERVKRRRKSETLYAVASTQDVGAVFYYLCLDESANFLRSGHLRIDCKRIGQSDKLSPGTFNLKMWNLTSTNKPYPFFLFENYFYALAYKLQCDHDQQTGG